MILFLAGQFALSTMKEVNRALLIYFVAVMETDEFRAYFSLDALHVKRFLEWVLTSNTTAATLIAKVVRTKANARPKPLKLTTFANTPNRILQKLGTAHVRQVLQYSLVVATHT